MKTLCEAILREIPQLDEAYRELYRVHSKATLARLTVAVENDDPRAMVCEVLNLAHWVDDHEGQAWVRTVTSIVAQEQPVRLCSLCDAPESKLRHVEPDADGWNHCQYCNEVIR